MVFCLFPLIPAHVFALLLFLSFEWLLLVTGPCFQPQAVAESGSCDTGAVAGVWLEKYALTRVYLWLGMYACNLLGLLSLPFTSPQSWLRFRSE